MSKEWYLLKPPNDMMSGYEDEAFHDFAEDGFAELLDSEIAQTIELCNADLTVCKPIRAIVQNNVSDSKLNTTTRQMLVAIGTCRAGMYFRYKKRYWLIVGLVDDNMVYEKAVCVLCNYRLSWQNCKGQIIKRWANIVSAAQYNNGETNTKHYVLRSDQILVLTPDDDECLLIDHGQRFIIDRRCSMYEKEFGTDAMSKTDKPVIVYQVTRNDSVLFDYQDSGHHEFMMSQDEQRPDDGYYIVDGEGHWLCGVPTRKVENDILTCEIECESDEIYVQLEPGLFTAKFYDENGNEVDIEPVWEIDSAVSECLSVERAGKSVTISADDIRCVGKNLTLMLSAPSYPRVTKEIAIKAFL